MAIRGFASLDELVGIQNRLADMYGWSAPHAKQHLDEYISQFGCNPEWLFLAKKKGPYRAHCWHRIAEETGVS